MSRKKASQSTKQQKFSSLVEIVHTAFHTGEFRDPGFGREIYAIVDDIFSEELDQIRLVAHYERELLKRDGEIMRLQALKAIQENARKHMTEMEKGIRAVFREIAERDPAQAAEKARKIVHDGTAALGKDNDAVLRATGPDFERMRRPRVTGMEQTLMSLTKGFRRP